ncbi:MAG: alpha/beta fold hydrolase [Streptomycetales bacterium]
MARTRPTRRLPTAEGGLEYLLTGRGLPVTVFAPGLGATIAETRPFGSGVAGTRVFLRFRWPEGSTAGYGADPYGVLARDLRAVAEHVGATRALGVSLGAGALLRLMADAPTRFERLVFALPAVLDDIHAGGYASRLATLAALAGGRDVDGLARRLLAEQPAAVRRNPQAALWARRQAAALAYPGLAGLLPELAGRAPLVVPAGRAALAKVKAPALVIGQEADDAHPEAVARELAHALPRAHLHVLSEGGALWLARQRIRQLVSEFLNAPAGAP